MVSCSSLAALWMRTMKPPFAHSLGLFWFLCVQNEPEPAVRKSYQAVERDGEIIRVRDTVLLKSGPRKKSMPYVAKISALWEDPKTGTVPGGWVCAPQSELEAGKG